MRIPVLAKPGEDSRAQVYKLCGLFRGSSASVKNTTPIYCRIQDLPGQLIFKLPQRHDTSMTLCQFFKKSSIPVPTPLPLTARAKRHSEE